MFGRSVGFAATCALGASALIIPPGVSPATHEHNNDHGDSAASGLSATVVDPKNQVITLPCAECAFATRPEKLEEAVDEEDFVWIQGGANSLVLNFTVSEDGAELRLNGEGIYPPTFLLSGDAPNGRVVVKQVPSNTGLVDIKNGDVRSMELEVTAYGLKEGEKEPLSANGDVLVPLRFEIMGLENEFMELDEVAIDLLQTGAGELLIMDVAALSPKHPYPHHHHHHDDEMEDEDGEEDFPVHHRPHGPPHHEHEMDEMDEMPEDEDAFGGVPPPFAHHRPHGDMDEMMSEEDDFEHDGPPPPFFRHPHGPPHDEMEEIMPEDEDFEHHGPPPSFFHHRPHGRPHGAPHDFKHKECNMLPEPLCKFKNMIESKIDAAMGPPPHGFRKMGGGCRKGHGKGAEGKAHGKGAEGKAHGKGEGKGKGKHLPGHIKPQLMKPSEEDEPKHHYGRPHHFSGPDGRHHHHHHHHGPPYGHMLRHHFLHAFAKGLVAVLIPVMAGVTVGMTVSLMGLVVGRLIGFLWIRLVRGGRRGYASVALRDEDIEDEEVRVGHVEDEEKSKVVLAEMEAPPVYEDAPAYEVVVDEKEEK